MKKSDKKCCLLKFNVFKIDYQSETSEELPNSQWFGCDRITGQTLAAVIAAKLAPHGIDSGG